MLLLAAAVFAYFTLADDGWPLRDGAALRERPTGLPLAEWGEAPLVVYLSAGEGGQLYIETRTEFEAGVGTMSVWLQTPDESVEFVNYDALYIGERSAAWSGELNAELAEVQAVSARYRGKLTQPARDFICERQDEVWESAGELAWVCETR